MPQSVRHPLVLAAVCAVLFFANLGATHLWDVDEAIFAAAAKEMHVRGDHVVPYFNGEVFTHKPAMMYWFMLAAYEMFGPTEFAARFWSAVFSIGSVLLTYRLGRLLFSPAVGFSSALVLATSLNFNVIARAATPDAFLVFFSTLAVLVFVTGTSRSKSSSPGATVSLGSNSASSSLRPSGATAGLSSSAPQPQQTTPTNQQSGATPTWSTLRPLGATAGLSSSALQSQQTTSTNQRPGTTTATSSNLRRPLENSTAGQASSGTHGHSPSSTSDDVTPWSNQTVFNPSWACYAGAYAAMGCGVLTKGPIGVLLPTAVIGLFLLVMRARPIELSARSGWRASVENSLRWLASVLNPKLFVETVWSMRPLTAVAVVLLVAGPWYALVGWRTDGQWLIGFFGVHNFGRFFGAMENHRGPIFYYLLAIAAGFFPWSVLFSPGWTAMRRRLSATDPWRAGYVLVGSWAAVWVGFFSLAGTKLPSYVVPAYPAIALFLGAFIDGWLREPKSVGRTWNYLIWGTVALAGVGMAVAFPIVAHLYLGDDWLLGTIGLIPLAAAAVGFHFGRQQNTRAQFATLSVLGVTLALALFAFGAVRVDRHQASASFGRLIASHTPAGEQPQIASFNYFRPSLVFYSDHAISEFSSPADVPTFFATHPEAAFVFTTDEAYKKIEAELPADVSVLESRPRFLHAGRILLLSRRGQGDTARVPSESSVRR